MTRRAPAATERMRTRVRGDTRFLYVYSPTGSPQNEKWVFTDKVCLSLHEAFEHVLTKEEK